MSDISIQKLARELKKSPQELAIIANNNDIRGINKNSIVSNEIADLIRRLVHNKNDNKDQKQEKTKKSNKEQKDKKQYVKEETFDKTSLVSNDNDINDAMFDSIMHVIKQYRQCWGYEIAYCHFIRVPFTRYSISVNQETLIPFNIVEKIILEVINAKPIEVSSKYIADYLELNYLIVNHYFNGFVSNNMIHKNYDNVYEFTENGRQAYKNGYKLHKETDLDFDILVNNKWGAVDQINDVSFYYSYGANIENYSVVDEDGIISYTQSQLIKIMKDSDLCDKNSSYSITKIDTHDTLFKIMCVISVYDFINNNTVNVLYDLSQGRIIDNRQDIIDEMYDIIKRQPKYQQRIDSLAGVIEEEVFEKYNIAELYTENRANENAEDKIKQYYDSIKIRELLLEKIENAKSYVMIHCPWIKDGAVNDVMITSMTKAVKNGIKIFITYGIDQSENAEQSSQNAIERLRSISDSKSGGRVFINWIGNDHSKESIIDGDLLLTGSFNFLSFNPYDADRFNSEVRNETTLAIYDENIAKVAKEKYTNYLYEACSNHLDDETMFLCLLNYFEELADKAACEILLNYIFSEDNIEKDWYIELINNRIKFFSRTAAVNFLSYIKKHKMTSEFKTAIDRMILYHPEAVSKANL